MLLQFLINGLITGSIYALAALGFGLVYNTTRIFHVAYSSLYMFAPYMMFTVFVKLECPLVYAIATAICLTMVLSIAIEVLVYRPLNKRKSSLNVLMISSIGVMIIIVNVIALFYGNETKILNLNISKTIIFGNIIITYIQLLQFLTATSLILLFILYLKYTKTGNIARAMRDDEELSKIFAVNIPFIRILMFSISGLFISISGLLVAWDVGMNPYVGMPLLLNAVVALIIGGIGRFTAPVIGGFVIGLLQAITVWQFSANWQNAITFALLMIFLFLRPQGFMGEKRRLV